MAKVGAMKLTPIACQRVSLTSCFRLFYTDRESPVTRLDVERRGYQNKKVSVKFTASSLGNGFTTIAGTRVYFAQSNSDFDMTFGEITFLPGEVNHTVIV